MTVVVVIHADRHRRTRLRRRDHRRRQFEAQKMYRGGLLIVLALEILVGDRPSGREAVIPAGARVQVGELTFTLTDWV